MAPSRKSRSANKRFSYINEVTPTKNVENVNKSRPRKRKLSDMLGPQWNKEELERFYKAYRKHGKDWDKVAAAVHSRSVEMVEALYTMNRAYLSLPKGYASAAGLIAMMTDHYSNLGDSDSDQEINESPVASQKPQKRSRGTKELDESPVRDLLRPQSASSYGCLSLLKKRRSGSRPWAVGKRTPRVPVTYAYDKNNQEKYVSPHRQGLKVKVDALDDNVAHEIALALAEASQRGGSPQVCQTPKRKTETPSPVQDGGRMHAESEMTNAKLCGSEEDEEDGFELSLGSTEADIGDYAREKNFWKGKRYHGRKIEAEESMDNHLEACSGTEEGQKHGVKGRFEAEVAYTKLSRAFNKGLRKRSKKVLFGEDEDTSFDALKTLADLSLRLPDTPVGIGSSVRVLEEKTGSVVKSQMTGNHPTAGVKVTSFNTTKQGKIIPPNVNAIPEIKEGGHQVNAGIRKRGQKLLPSKISESEEHTDSQLRGSQRVEATVDVNNFASKGKHSHDSAYPKQGKLMKPAEQNSSSNDHARESNDSAPSTVQVLSTNQFNLPTKVRSRRKMKISKPWIEKDAKSAENITSGQCSIPIPSFHDKAFNLKGKLSNCLSRYQVRRWCAFEWFYSAIDYPWFAKMEFVEYLEHVGLGHIPRLTRIEWGVIRSSLGKPRRFSKQFLKEEKEKLHQYRESVRKHYTELRAGTRYGLPTDLARPLSVGQRIIALHPRTREIHDGSVLTVDHSQCRVQFDQPELGVEFVKDVDCMPSNPLENMPASLTRHHITLNRCMENLNELKMNGQPVERITEGYVKFTSCENLENTSILPCTSPSTHQVSNLLQQAKGGSSSSNAQVNIDSVETVNVQQAANAQPSILAQIEAKEADIQALSELTRALDKKEVVVSELKHMNDEVLENQKDGENAVKNSETFKKHYAAVLLQLNEVNEKVSSALSCLRQRNTYQGSIPPMWLKPMSSMGEQADHGNSFDPSADDTQESGSHVAEIVESSKAKAQTMVDAAMQAMSSLKKVETTVESIEEAIDFVNNQLSVNDLNASVVRSSTSTNSVHGAMASQDQSSSGAADVGPINHAPDTKLNNLPDQNDTQIPSDLIAQCVATLLVIQKCSERQFPPSDIAHVLDLAVTSLKPCCAQNLPIYTEIQKCMGIIRNQILALIPT